MSRCDDRASDIDGMTVLEYRPNVRLDQGGDRYIFFNLQYAVCMRDTCIHMYRVLFVVSRCDDRASDINGMTVNHIDRPLGYWGIS